MARVREHWERIYTSKADDEVSWYEPVPGPSLELIRQLSPRAGARIIDVGAGSSSLVDRLLDDGFEVTALDLSEAALDRARTRLGSRANKAHWVVADITAVDGLGAFDIWHDRATFHFLVDPSDRTAYVRLLNDSVAAGGYALIATFNLNGPEKCSGLPVERYDSERLSKELGDNFELLRSMDWRHQTPLGTTQDFVYSMFRHL